MTVKEYNALQEAKGTPKVWIVETAHSCGCQIYTNVFETEQEAKEYYESQSSCVYRNMYRTWDIWGWTARHKKGGATA